MTLASSKDVTCWVQICVPTPKFDFKRSLTSPPRKIRRSQPQDMAPYVPLLIPELQQALIDPLPEVRATAAKAMGSLLRGMGQHHSQDLMPWLLETLKSEVN